MTEPDKSPVKTATVRQLAYKIKGNSPTPTSRFAVFLGAGASFESGIPLAGTMVADFAGRIIQEQCPEGCVDPQQQRAWLESQDWYAAARRQGTLYSELFERFEGKERGRQVYIEQMIDGKNPSFGYVVLANLMARNYITAVLTTNFDDLVYNACSSFTDIRPVVYAYGTMISDLRITGGRPKILKLHGDYLYSKLKNSGSELAHQDPNMSRHVPTLLNEYGLIVIGYGGGDRSVMELLRTCPPTNDLYWCGRAGTPIPDSVRSLLTDLGGFYVEIDSFDKMMNEIRVIVGFDVPKMLGSLEARQNAMIAQLQSTSASTLGSLGSIAREIADYRRQDAEGRERLERRDTAFVHYIGAYEALQAGDFARVEAEFRTAIQLNPDDLKSRVGLANYLTQQARFAEAGHELDAALPLSGAIDPEFAFARAYLDMVQGRYGDALTAFTSILDQASQAAVVAYLPGAYNGAGVCQLGVGRYAEAGAAFEKAIALDPAQYYPVFNLATLLTLAGRAAEAGPLWSKALSLWRMNDPIDLYNKALMEANLARAEQAVADLRAALADGRPGVARLALASVRWVESGSGAPPLITTLRAMLEAALSPATAASNPA